MVALKWIDYALSDTSTISTFLALPDRKALFVGFGLFRNWLSFCFENTPIPYIFTTTSTITLCYIYELSDSPPLRSWTRIDTTTANQTLQPQSQRQFKPNRLNIFSIVLFDITLTTSPQKLTVFQLFAVICLFVQYF